MCAIAGIVRFDGAPVRRDDLAGMAQAQKHRGPDGEGTWCEGPSGLAHRRLAIIDLTTAASQPMTAPGGEVLVYNGEVYNFKALQRELEALGHQFVSTSDTEVVLHAWAEWGEASLTRLNGHFAFAIWDPRRRCMVLARDRFGVKPLYYYDGGSFLAFASEIKGLLSLPAIPRKLCLPALNEYFTFQNIFTDRTLLEGIKLLPAGCALSIPFAATAAPAPFRFCDLLPSETPLDITADEAAEEVHRLFVAAVERQLISDVPLGSYLSGGIDSGSITTIARAKMGRLTTFTGGFDLSSASGLELGFDERRAAELLSNWLKTEHYEVVLHAGDMEAVLPQLIRALEDPRVGQCYPNYYVANLASKFVKVVLSGAGGDEFFAGYPWRYFRGLDAHGPQDYFRDYYGFWQRLVDDDQKPALFTPDVLKAAPPEEPFDVFRAVFEPLHGRLKTREQRVSASLYFETKTFLHGLLVVEDKISMAHSLETRLPFLDNDLVNFALRLPARVKLDGLESDPLEIDENEAAKRALYERQRGDGKVVLRRAMSKIIPKEVAARAKQGFSAPDASWFRGESVDYVTNLLSDPRARLAEVIQPSFVGSVLDQHRSGSHNHRLLIWSLLSFEWWLREFLPD
ncbi:MAG: asparagine synthase (glutamine-hydrolyzing) [Acidobacteriota bacterium]|nr:asparagine synthase (glutamine-hydrolyzing) [Acidobacteriota bacterium]